jgi:hypothetical protein
MDRSVEVLIVMAGLSLVTLAAFACYSWQQRRRVRRVEKGVKDYLAVRYGKVPTPLSINCSNDPLWPVLVAFDDPQTGIAHRLQFGCWRWGSTVSLLAATQDNEGPQPKPVPGGTPAIIRSDLGERAPRPRV